MSIQNEKKRSHLLTSTCPFFRDTPIADFWKSSWICELTQWFSRPGSFLIHELPLLLMKLWCYCRATVPAGGTGTGDRLWPGSRQVLSPGPLHTIPQVSNVALAPGPGALSTNRCSVTTDTL